MCTCAENFSGGRALAICHMASVAARPALRGRKLTPSPASSLPEGGAGSSMSQPMHGQSQHDAQVSSSAFRQVTPGWRMRPHQPAPLWSWVYEGRQAAGITRADAPRAAMLALAVLHRPGWHAAEQEVWLACTAGMHICQADLQVALLHAAAGCWSAAGL